MRELSVHTTISAPREAVYDFVADLAGRPAYTDHYLGDFRLARANSYGKGASARFRIDAPFAKEYAEIAIVEADRPRQLVEESRVGRRGRSRAIAIYEFIPEAGGNSTRVELTTFSEPATRLDRFRQRRAAGWLRRQTKTALERLRLIFEEPPSEPLARATVGGYEPLKAARFGARTGADPASGAQAGH